MSDTSRPGDGFQFQPARAFRAVSRQIPLARAPFRVWCLSHNVLACETHWLITDRHVRPFKGRRVPCRAHTGFCPHCAGATDAHRTPETVGYLAGVSTETRTVLMVEVRARHVGADKRLDPQWKGSLRGTGIRGQKMGTAATSPVELIIDEQPLAPADLPPDLDRVAWLLRVWSEWGRADLNVRASDGEHLLRPFVEPDDSQRIPRNPGDTAGTAG